MKSAEKIIRLNKPFFLKCNRYNINSHTLIIGDAAHAVVPFYGQGMNAVSIKIKHYN